MNVEEHRNCIQNGKYEAIKGTLASGPKTMREITEAIGETNDKAGKNRTMVALCDMRRRLGVVGLQGRAGHRPGLWHLREPGTPAPETYERAKSKKQEEENVEDRRLQSALRQLRERLTKQLASVDAILEFWDWQ